MCSRVDQIQRMVEQNGQLLRRKRGSDHLVITFLLLFFLQFLKSSEFFLKKVRETHSHKFSEINQ